jgi:hypothetical protein
MATEKEIIDSLKLDWLPTDFYNAEDLNRVEQATLTVRERVITFRGQLIQIESPVTTRDETSIEFADSLNRIERNILRLKLTFPETYIFNPSKTDWEQDTPFSFADARRLEQDLYDMWYRIENNISNIPYAGQLYAGELGVVF